jgi:hypothetical protein
VSTLLVALMALVMCLADMMQARAGEGVRGEQTATRGRGCREGKVEGESGFFIRGTRSVRCCALWPQSKGRGRFKGEWRDADRPSSTRSICKKQKTPTVSTRYVVQSEQCQRRSSSPLSHLNTSCHICAVRTIHRRHADTAAPDPASSIRYPLCAQYLHPRRARPDDPTDT